MASPPPLMPFLRPLKPPRPSTLRHFFRFFTTTLRKAETQSRQPRPRPGRGRNAALGQVDANLVASRTASPTYPPPWMKSLPRPKESRSSRRSAHPPKQRPYPTRQPSHHQPISPKLIPEAVTPLPPAQCAPNLAYFITRTPSDELPVYTVRKRGGNLKQTRVKKIDGSPEVLRDELRVQLGLEREKCVVNALTRHVVLKGHWKGEVVRFLRERMF